MHFALAEVWPYIRTPAQGGYHYDHTGPFTTAHPPMVGDLITLPSDTKRFRVVARQWEYPKVGSQQWAADEEDRRVFLSVVLEESESMFVDDVPRSDAA